MKAAARALAEWGLDLSYLDIPPSVADAARRHLTDGLGVAIAAARTNAVPAAIAVASSPRRSGEATIIGFGVKEPAQMAAFANGALVHALDYDDTHTGSLVHTTAAVLPAAFAVGEETNASGSEVLAACIAGYEVVTRLGAAVPHGFHKRGFHATSACGVFASALIAARLMRLDVDRATNALGIAGSLASGSLEFLNTGTSTKQLHPGFAAMNGIIAARLAAAGADGPETILEGGYGLFRSFTGDSVDPAKLTDGLGSRWETEQITIKPYAACQLVHASLDALASIAIDARDVDSIVFDIPPDSIPIVCEPAGSKRQPRTPYEGKFSLPYCAAALLIDGQITIDSFDEARLERKEILDLTSRISYRAKAFAGVPADAPGIVEVTLSDGRVSKGRAERSRGGADLPLTNHDLMEKFIANCGGDRRQAEKLGESVLLEMHAQQISDVLGTTATFVGSDR